MSYLQRRLEQESRARGRRTPREALDMINVALEEAGRQPTTSGRRIWHPFTSRAEFEAYKRRERFYAEIGQTPQG